MDEDFIRQIRTTFKCALSELDDIRKRKAINKKIKDADSMLNKWVLGE